MITRRGLPVVTGLLLTLAMAALHLGSHPDSRLEPVAQAMGRVDAMLYDLRLRAMAPEEPARYAPLVIVDIDEASLDAEGRWPWSRATMARLLDALVDEGATVIGFDIAFPDAEQNPVAPLRERVTTAALQAELDRLQASLDPDLAFADSLQRARAQGVDVVLGWFWQARGRARGQLPEALLPVPSAGGRELTAPRFRGYSANLPAFARHARQGFVVVVPDPLDGAVRRAPLLARHQGGLYGALALETARAWLLQDNLRLEVADKGQVLVPVRLHLGDAVAVPLDDIGQVLVPFRGPRGSFPYLPATDVLHGTLDAGDRSRLDQAVVLVGSSALGLFDLRNTPVGPAVPGVEVHANVVEALIASAYDPEGRHFPVRPDWAFELVLVLILLVGVLSAVILPRLPPTSLVLLGGGLLVGWVALDFALWRQFGLDLPVVPLAALISLLATANLVFALLREAANRRELRTMFEQYVPPAHVDHLIATPEHASFDGESRVMTVLFSDIRSFTSISEGLNAAEVKVLLNEFFTPITGVIFDHHGTIDKYVGDMVMALWNAPLPDPAHREHAIDAGLAMLRVAEQLGPRFRALGLPEVRIGVGINSGLMNVGDMGSRFRRAYTVMGDAVNLASRIESITKTYGLPLLVGEDTRDGADGFLYRFVDRVQVQGKSRAVRVYQPLCRQEEASDELRSRISRYHEAYWLYAEQAWDRAAAAFDRLIAEEPDLLLYRVYRRRIELLRHAPLGLDWDGTEILTEK